MTDATTCRRCPVGVLEALTATGLTVTLDAEPLDPLGELRAQVAGGTTYTRHLAGEVHPRTPATITERPAGTHPRQTVHARHRCTPTPAPLGV